MSDCWRCDQKAEYKNQKLNDAREQARLLSAQTNKTVAIVQKSGCIYEAVDLSEVGTNPVKEYISANTG